MTPTAIRPGRGSGLLRTATRAVACTALVAALSLSNPAPASAATVTTDLYYGQNTAGFNPSRGIAGPTNPSNNSYSVEVSVTVTSAPGSSRYDLTARFRASCHRASSRGKFPPHPDAALQFGGSGEPWWKLEIPCGNGESGASTTRATLTSYGTLSSDRVVHLRAGAWGGSFSPFGTWGWSERQRVTV